MVFEEIAARVKGLFPGISGISRAEFPRTLTEDDLTSDTTLVTNKYTMLGTGFRVPAQQQYFVGQGTPNQPMNQGYIYVNLLTAESVQIEGKVRVAVYDANDRLKGIVFEERTEVLRGSTTDRQLKQALPVNRAIVASEDDYIAVLVMADTALTYSVTNSTILLPVTNVWMPR